MFVYVGGYTESPAGNAEGISAYRFDPESGALTPALTVRDVVNPSFLAMSGDQRFLYAVNERADGGVTSFARNLETGELTALNQQQSHGADPCYISVDKSGRYALVANYSSGIVTALPIAADGRLGPATSVIQHEGSSVVAGRQDGPHAHMIAPTPDGRYVLATDLGTDQVIIYQLDLGTGTLRPNPDGPASVRTEAGAGPRHFAFAPNGHIVYVINELSSTLSVYAYDGEVGTLTPIQSVSTLPEEFRDKSTCAQVVVSPDGRFVYGSNRGHDSIAIFAVEGAGGEVRPVGHEPTQGKSPRNIALDPGGAWLLAANQRSDTITVFRRDQESGLLTATGRPTPSPTPVAMVFAGSQ
jgi:6-phosphogluconolactonase